MNLQPPGDSLRRLRIRLGITTRDVENLSQKIAEEEKNPEFQISNAWLTQLHSVGELGFRPKHFQALFLSCHLSHQIH